MNQLIVVALSLCVSFAYGADILSTDRPTVAPLDPKLRFIFTLETDISDVIYDLEQAKTVKGSFIKDDVDVDPEVINSIRFSLAKPQTFGARGSTSNEVYPEGSFEIHQNHEPVATVTFGKYKAQLKNNLKAKHSCQDKLISAPGAKDLRYEITCYPQE